ncbi:hypothetical protein NDR87_00950 [Nocardia sp. CDC159]|uniref:Uncharacterized protein n=1 Tax=Nocardia pulmonis TaxID=2951408 RepID=A0A9X2IVG1_9NOCA|nr:MULTISPECIES: hypothetical protein [Nocardia]MCM6772419.1 hypothetical protein [Nocardia pulmonis]MCM6784923.1 hypothetical protein [Nocardia sp. CDC159]
MSDIAGRGELRPVSVMIGDIGSLVLCPCVIAGVDATMTGRCDSWKLLGVHPAGCRGPPNTATAAKRHREQTARAERRALMSGIEGAV